MTKIIVDDCDSSTHRTSLGKNPSILLITLSQPQLCVLGLLVPFRTMLCLVKYTMVRIGKTHQLYHAVQSVFSNKTMVPMVFVLRSTR